MVCTFHRLRRREGPSWERQRDEVEENGRGAGGRISLWTGGDVFLSDGAAEKSTASMWAMQDIRAQLCPGQARTRKGVFWKKAPSTRGAFSNTLSHPLQAGFQWHWELWPHCSESTGPVPAFPSLPLQAARRRCQLLQLSPRILAPAHPAQCIPGD